MKPISIQTERPVLHPNEAIELGGDEATNEKSQGMDVDTPGVVEEVDGKEDIAETQVDSLSLLNLDSCQIKVEEPEQKLGPSKIEV